VSAITFDVANPENVAGALGEANRRLERETVTPPETIELIADVSRQIADTPREQWATVAPDAWIELQQAAMRAQRIALGGTDDRARRRELRLLLEELRFRLARLAEHAAYDPERPIDDVLRWLDDALPVPQTVKAELLGVHDRTYQRWISAADAGRPNEADDQRARLVARLVGDLRHVLTGPGMVRWLRSPLAALDDRTPLEAIDEADPDELRRLFGLVAAVRSGAAG
jgi:hypothetical protein